MGKDKDKENVKSSSKHATKKFTRMDSVVITDTTPNCPPEMIAVVRERLEVEYAKDPDAFEPMDVERMRTCEWTVSRYILRNHGDIDATVEMALKAGRWRKDIGMV